MLSENRCQLKKNRPWNHSRSPESPLHDIPLGSLEKYGDREAGRGKHRVKQFSMAGWLRAIGVSH